MHILTINENACNFEEIRQALATANANFAKLQAEIDAIKAVKPAAAPAASGKAPAARPT